MSHGSEVRWRILDWDSEFFGFRIARVTDAQFAESSREIVEECMRQGVRCLYFLADADDIGTIRALEQQGFGFADVRLTLVHRPPITGQPLDVPGIRRAHAEDLPALERTARASHHDSRFYADSNFPRDRCDSLYATWIAKSCTGGFADVVFVAESASGEAGGYVTCSMIQRDCGQIGLLAVAPEARGSGAGGRLIGQAIAWAQSQGATSVITVTQGRNVAAVRAYERCGFVAQRMQLWYHRWFEVGATG